MKFGISKFKIQLTNARSGVVKDVLSVMLVSLNYGNMLLSAVTLINLVIKLRLVRVFTPIITTHVHGLMLEFSEVLC